LRVTLGNGDRTFQDGIALPMSGSSRYDRDAVADLNRDGKLDLAAAVTVSGKPGVNVLLNQSK
jgi:hypothetical protein